jgi:adenylate cyclase
MWAGQTDLAIERAEMAFRLSPRALAGVTSWLIGAALFFSRRFDEAVPRLRVAVEEDMSLPTPYRLLAACYAHMGRLDEARTTVARLRTLTPEVIPTYPLPFREPAHRELYFSGLRLALGQETAAEAAGPSRHSR